MKKGGGWVVLGVILLFVFVVVLSSVGWYNKMVDKRESVTKAWQNVEAQYQRRADLIPNLVNTVKGYADYESQTLEAVIAARAAATSTQVNINDAESFRRYMAAQNELNSALSRLLAISESYPDLKANQNFLSLQAQLEGTENRISTERIRYNEDVADYNRFIKRFPKNIIARNFGFEPMSYFEAAEGAEQAPVVEF